MICIIANACLKLAFIDQDRKVEITTVVLECRCLTLNLVVGFSWGGKIPEVLQHVLM